MSQSKSSKIKIQPLKVEELLAERANIDHLKVCDLNVCEAFISQLLSKCILTTNLEAKKADITNLETANVKTINFSAASANITNLTSQTSNITNLIGQTGTFNNLNVSQTAKVCDLVVTCDIFMEQTVGPSIGNIFKGGERFISNFGISNVFVGKNSGNFTLNLLDSVQNSGFGDNTLQSLTTGENNSASGPQSLQNNTSGNNNTGSGFRSLFNNITGNDNAGFGQLALSNILTGDNNIGIGSESGINLTDNDSNNIDIGNGGVVGENGTIRFGTNGIHVRNFQAGIRGTGPLVGSNIVYIDANGQLNDSGIPSAKKYKENIIDLGDTSALLELRPVQFTYKPEFVTNDEELGKVHTGFIADEVYQHLPQVVIKKDGEIESLDPIKLIPYLVNELITQHKLNLNLSQLVNSLASRLDVLENATKINQK